MMMIMSFHSWEIMLKVFVNWQILVLFLAKWASLGCSLYLWHGTIKWDKRLLVLLFSRMDWLTFLTSLPAHYCKIVLAVLYDVIFLRGFLLKKDVFCSDELSCELWEYFCHLLMQNRIYFCKNMTVMLKRIALTLHFVLVSRLFNVLLMQTFRLRTTTATKRQFRSFLRRLFIL